MLMTGSLRQPSQAEATTTGSLESSQGQPSPLVSLETGLMGTVGAPAPPDDSLADSYVSSVIMETLQSTQKWRCVLEAHLCSVLRLLVFCGWLCHWQLFLSSLGTRCTVTPCYLLCTAVNVPCCQLVKTFGSGLTSHICCPVLSVLSPRPPSPLRPKG